MPDLTEQVREALALPFNDLLQVESRLPSASYRAIIRNARDDIAAAVARAAEAAAEAACSHCCGDSESRASVRQQAVDSFLAKLREASDA